MTKQCTTPKSARARSAGDAKVRAHETGERRARARATASAADSPRPRRKVYLLMNKDNSRTYIGSTPSVEHRLRQHNREIAGGAWSTSLSVKMGLPWRVMLHVEGFNNDADAYKFEAAWKKANKKFNRKSIELLERKMRGLRQLIPVGAREPHLVWKHFIDLTGEWDV